MKKFKRPTPALSELWKKNFHNDCSKFVRTNNLLPTDFMREFEDAEGKKWRILGSMEGRDMPCELLETGEVFIWDRWKVSLLLYPEKHLDYKLRVPVTFPTVRKKRAAKKTEEEAPREEKVENHQLNLFDDEEEVNN
jgi:hypothetical protein